MKDLATPHPEAGTDCTQKRWRNQCTVRNISRGGAYLEVANPIGIPDDFALVIASDQIERRCHVTWRRDKRIGVAFD
jgi:hypothetical protein